MAFDWTEQAKSYLALAWANGDTCTQIAAALGGGLSRNSVAGKASRMGLMERGNPIGKKGKYKPEAKPRAQYRRRDEAGELKRAYKPVDPARIALKAATAWSAKHREAPNAQLALRLRVPSESAEPVVSEPWNGNPVSLSKIGAGQCRWIVGTNPDASPLDHGGTHLMCGAPQERGSYCHAHAAKATDKRKTEESREKEAA